jgi:hypothetical protein
MWLGELLLQPRARASSRPPGPVKLSGPSSPPEGRIRRPGTHDKEVTEVKTTLRKLAVVLAPLAALAAAFAGYHSGG